MAAAKDECTLSRQIISDRPSGSGNDVALDMALSGMIDVEDGVLGRAAVENAARHIAECPGCQVWLEGRHPERAVARERLARYCCVHMLGAATDPQEPIRFSFEMFRGEDACWCINGEWVFARFCPWCGKALPPGGFE